MRVVLKDGTSVTGRLLNQDAFSIQLLDAKELGGELRVDVQSGVPGRPQEGHALLEVPDARRDCASHAMTGSVAITTRNSAKRQ